MEFSHFHHQLRVYCDDTAHHGPLARTVEGSPGILHPGVASFILAVHLELDTSMVVGTHMSSQG